MSGSDMNNSSETNWALVDSLTDEMIDQSEIPPLDESFFARAVWRMPEGQALITTPTNPDLMRKQQIELRRQEIAADARAARAAFRAGMLKPQSAEDLILDLHRSLDDPE
jgi:hypothetical protein